MQVGVYIKTIVGPNSEIDMDTQKTMIEEELWRRGISKEQVMYFSDFVDKNKNFSYKGLKELISAISVNSIAEVFVDLNIRLTGTRSLTLQLNSLIAEKNISVVEVAKINRSSDTKPVAAIYHCMSARKGSEIYRTKGALLDIASMYAAIKNAGYDVGRVYLDKSFIEARSEREILINENLKSVELLVVKSFYHLTRRVGSLAGFVSSTRIISCEEGELVLKAKPERSYNVVLCSANDDKLLAEKTTLFLKRVKQYKVIGEVKSLNELTTYAESEYKPDVILFPSWNQVYVDAVSRHLRSGISIASMEGILSIKKGGD